MKQIKIDLAGSFEDIVAKLRSIPPTDILIDSEDAVASEPSSEVAEVLRSLYEAARGRQIATQIGLVQIAPPVAAFLKDAPFYVETQADFLLQALARLYAGSCFQNQHPFARDREGNQPSEGRHPGKAIFPPPAAEPFLCNQIGAKPHLNPTDSLRRFARKNVSCANLRRGSRKDSQDPVEPRLLRERRARRRKSAGSRLGGYKRIDNE